MTVNPDCCKPVKLKLPDPSVVVDFTRFGPSAMDTVAPETPVEVRRLVTVPLSENVVVVVSVGVGDGDVAVPPHAHAEISSRTTLPRLNITITFPHGLRYRHRRDPHCYRAPVSF